MKGFYTLLMGLLWLLGTPQLSAQTTGFAVSNANGTVGQQVCLQITGSNFNEVLGFQFSLDYDPMDLQFASATGQVFFGQTVFVSNSAPGDIRVSWNVFSADVLTDVGPFQVAQICFNVLREVETTVAIVGMPIGIEVNTTTGTETNLSLTDGIVNQGQVGGPSCTDGVQNGNETGVDCGGPDCPACPTCNDGIRNGNETGVDCGGPDCAACPPTCNDGVQNGNETGVDCGGPDCGACPTCDDGVRNGRETGVDCGGPDCAACPPTCNDGVRNGSETGVDCGGPDCAACPTCNDGIQNNGETGVDCGGPNCAPCQAQGDCGAGSSNLNLCLNDLCVDAGQQACVDLTVTNFMDVTGMEFRVNYPGTSLEYVSSTSNAAFVGGVQVTGMIDGQLRVLWFDQSNDFSGIDIPNGDVAMTFCFTVENEANATVNLSLVNLTDPDGQVIAPVELRIGSVNGPACGGTTPTCSDGIQNGNETGVDCGGPDCAPCNTGGGDVCGEGSNELNFCVDNVCADPNTQVCVDIDVANFNTIAGFQFDVNYPAANLQFVSGSSNPGLPGGGAQINGNNDGEVTVLWFDGTQEFNGGTLADGAAVVTLCFTVQSAATTILDVNSISASLPSGATVSAVGNPGSVNAPACSGTAPTCTDGIQNGNETGVDCGGPDCAPCNTGGAVCGEGSNDLNFCVDNVCADLNTQVCVDVDVTNFTSIAGFQFEINYPAANLQFVSGSSNPELPGGGAQINGNNDGVVTVLWFDGTQEFNGGTLADGSAVVTLCFTVQSAAVTSLTLSDISASLPSGATVTAVANSGSVNAPACSGTTPTCTDGIQNGNETGVDCGGPDCAPCDTGGDVCGEGSDDLNLCVDNVCADVNSQVCVDIDVTNFTTIAGFQFQVSYPAANLQFVSGSSNAGLPGGGAQINGGTDGEVTVLWFDGTQEFNGGTLDDGSALVTLCFTVQSAATTPLNISEVSASLPSGATVTAVGNPGSVNAPACNGSTPTCTDGIQNGNETGIDCGGPDCAPCGTGEQGDLTLTVGSATASVGDEVCVDLSVNGFDDVRGLSFTINYDASRLQLASFVPTSDLSGFSAANFNLTAPGALTVSWSGASGQALPNNSSLVELCFTAIGEGNTVVSVTNGATATAGDGMAVNVLRAPGTIVITNDFDNLAFIMGSGFGDVNDEVCLDVPVYNFTSITSFSFTIQYDPTKVSYESLTASANFPPGGGYQVSNPNPGEVRVIWLYNPPDFAGITVPDGTTAFSVCFTVLDACEALVELTDNPTSIAATDNNGNSLPVTVVAGGINRGIPCGGCSLENLVLDVSDGSASVGEEVCVSVTAENFSALTDLQFTMMYDPAVLAFVRLENFGLGSIDQSDFTVGPAGRIVFDWSSATAQGQSIANGGTVFDVCFTVSSLEQTAVNLSSNPVPILASNSCSANVGVIPMNGMINAGVPMGDGLTLQVLCSDAAVNTEVCVPIRVFDFTDLLGFQFSLDYDPQLLEFVRLADDPAIPILVNNSAPGDIRVQWSDLSGATATIPDGGILGEFCFRVLNDDPATVAFANQPIRSEFLNENGDIIDVTLLNCAVNGSGAPQISNAVITPPTCHDSQDGSIELTVTGPSTLAYNWIPNPNNSTGGTLTNIGAGSYMVEVINTSTGERTTRSFVVEAPPPFMPTVDSENVSCFNEQDGSITVNPVGGVAPFTYDWSGSLQDGIAQQTGLDGGLYSVTVTDANGCDRAFNNIQITAPSAEISIPGLITNITAQPGAITIQVLGGTGMNTYSWTGPMNFSSTAQNITGLTEPGTYCVTIADANGCTAAQCFSVTEALRIVQDNNFSAGCAGLDNGFIDLTVSGGDEGYTYSWTGPDGFTATTQDISSLAPGVYMVTVSSGQETVTSSFTLETPQAITLGASVFPATSGNNGRIVLTPNGGTPPYTYDWSNDETTSTIGMLTPGEYCVTVTDSEGCVRQNCYTIEAVPLTVAGFSTSSPTCFAGEDGTASIIISNGTGPYVATATPGNFTGSSTSDTVTINLPAGTFTVTIVDDQGGMVSQEVTVVAPTPIIAADTSVVSDTEDAECTGGITLMIAGGTGPYSVAWNLPALSGPQVTGLCAGTYEATITDANGCESETISVVIGQLTEDATMNTVECPGDASGMIDLTVAGGIPPYSFSWRNAANEEIATTEDLTGVTDGDYTVTITDAGGAILVRTYTIGTGAGFSATATATSNYNGFGVSCAGAFDGTLAADVSGLGNYTYEWFLDGMMVGVDSVLNNREAGDYTVNVSSEGGCVQTVAVTLTAPEVITIQSDVVPVSCANERDGSVSVSVSGGVSPYRYRWSNGTTLPGIQFVRAGAYQLTVTDRNDCVIVTEFNVNEPPELVVTFEATDADDGCNGTVTILPLGGPENFNYSWEQLPAQGNDNVATGLCPGVYTVEVFDEFECQSVTVRVTVRDRRFPCLSERNVITPNGDGLNEAFILFCSDGSEISNNTLEIYNRWGQLVYRVADYNCSEDGGLNCFEGRTNDGNILPEGAYYYVLDYSNPVGERQQKKGSISILYE